MDINKHTGSRTPLLALLGNQTWGGGGGGGGGGESRDGSVGSAFNSDPICCQIFLAIFSR